MIEKPMLAETCTDITKLHYPVMVSPKLDGIRCIKRDGLILSRKLKPIPNEHIRTQLQAVLPDGADGELMCGLSFQETSSAVMSRDGAPDFVFFWFDYLPTTRHISAPFQSRFRLLDTDAPALGVEYVEAVPHVTISTPQELEDYENSVLEQGFEGVMIRDPQGPYKFGRSTLKEGWLLKLKRFTDGEAEILECEELFRNENELGADALGYAKRSQAKKGMVPAGTLGRFRVRDVRTGAEFWLGSGVGLTAALRAEIWAAKERYKGRVLKYKHQPHGALEAPRLPVFLGFRDPID